MTSRTPDPTNTHLSLAQAAPKNQILDRHDLIELTEAMNRLPHRPHRSTGLRWGTRGYQLPSGDRVYLPLHRIGRRIFVTEPELAAFVQAIGEGHQHREQQRPEVRTARAPRRSSRAEQAEREAQELGI